jgi:hypothetical protein
MKKPHRHDVMTATLLKKVQKAYPKEFKRVWTQIEDHGDIDPTFVGFIDKYRHLSNIIPRNRIIVDIGCAYAFQAYYFRNHRFYVGIDPTPKEDRLQTPNSIHHELLVRSSAYLMGLDYGAASTEPVFAICSYCPDSRAVKAMKEVFRDCFSFYPQQSQAERKRNKFLL